MPLEAYEVTFGQVENAEVVLGDYGVAAELLDSPRPDSTGDRADWLLEFAAVDADRTGQVLMPPLLNQVGPALRESTDLVAHHDEVAAELGFGPPDVDRFIAIAGVPSSTFVVGGELEVGDGLIDLGDGVVSAGDGDDFSIERRDEGQTLARPLGRPLRLAERDGVIIASTETAQVASWLADGPTLLDDPDLVATTRIFDEARASVAVILTGQDQTIAGGQTVTDDRRANVFVYALADDAAAAAGLAEIEDRWTTGDLRSLDLPVSDRFELISSSQDGRRIVVVAAIVDGSTLDGFELLGRGDPILGQP